METISGLTEFQRRGAGTDSERRAALWLSRQLAATGRDVRLEPFWCRSNWAFAHLWHVALGLAGSLVSVASARVGGALILLALLSVIADELTGVSPGRRLTFERASQNVIAAPTAVEPGRVRLIITANYDAGRTGLVYRRRARAAAARLRQLSGGRAPGWLAWLALALIWLLATAILRLEGDRGTAIGVLQLLPTVALVLMLAALIDLAGAEFGPAAGDNSSGAAVAIAVARALDAAPPRNLETELVLQGAGDGGGIGLRRYLRRQRPRRRATDTVVLGIAPCGSGRLRWWVSDGTLVPLRYLARLRGQCEQIAHQQQHLQARPHRGRGATPALPARAARLPAIAIGCLDERGLVPHSHAREDTPDAVEEAAPDAAVAFALMLVDAIDAYVGGTRAPAGTTA